MIRLHVLEVDNFRQLREVELTFPERCTVLVEGENESGKSTLFEAVYYALYGKPVSEADNFALVHNRATKGLVRLVFSVDGVRCEIVRKLNRGAQRVTSRGELTVSRGEAAPYTINGNERIAEELNVLLHGLDADAMRHSCYVEQKGLDRTADLSVEGRKTLLLKLLDQSDLVAIGKQYDRSKPSDAVLLRARQVVELGETYTLLREARAAHANATTRLRRAELASATARWTDRLSAAAQLEAERAQRAGQAEHLADEIAAAGRLATAAAELRQLAETRQALAGREARLAELDGDLAELASLAEDALPRLRGRRDLVRHAQELLAARDRAEEARQQAEERGAALLATQRYADDLAPLRAEVNDLGDRLAQAHAAAQAAERAHANETERERTITLARERETRLLGLNAEAEAVASLSAELGTLVARAETARAAAQAAQAVAEAARQAERERAGLATRVADLHALAAEVKAVGTFSRQVAAQREAAQAARQSVSQRQSHLDQARARHADLSRVASLKEWADAHRAIVHEQKSLRDSVAAADQAITSARAGSAAVEKEAQRATAARWWALAAGVPALGALVAAAAIAALVIGGRIALLIDSRVLIGVLAGVGLGLAAAAVALWLRASRRANQARARAAALEASARVKETERATSQGALGAFEQKAVGLLAPPRAKLAAHTVAEPPDVDAAEAMAAEILASVGGPEGLPDLDQLAAAVAEASAQATTLEADLARDDGSLAEQARQLTRRLVAAGLRSPDDLAPATAELEARMTQRQAPQQPLSELEREAAEQSRLAGEADTAHRNAQATLTERKRALAAALAAAGAPSNAALADALQAARHVLADAEANGAADVAGRKTAWEQAAVAERALAAEHGPKVGELRGREARLVELLRVQGLGDVAAIPAAAEAATRDEQAQAEARAAAARELNAELAQLGALGAAEPGPWLSEARVAVEAEIRQGQDRLAQKGRIEAERARVDSERARLANRSTDLEMALAGRRALDETIPEPVAGQELEQAQTLERRHGAADVPALQVAERQAREQAGRAASGTEQARGEAEAAWAQALALLAELGQRDVSLAVPGDVRACLPDLPEPPTSEVLAEFARQREALGHKVAGFEQQCLGLQAQLQQDPAALDLAAERERLAGLERQARTASVAARILERTRTNVINQLVPATLDNACLFLPVLTSGRYHDAVLDERSFQLKVWDAAFNRMVEREVYSGGAQDQFALALRLGFALAALPQELGAAPAFIFLDEPVASFDRVRREAFVSLIRGGLIGERFDQILVAEPEGIFPENPFPHFLRLEAGRLVEQSWGNI